MLARSMKRGENALMVKVHERLEGFDPAGIPVRQAVGAAMT